jgi:hypothetical protein
LRAIAQVRATWYFHALGLAQYRDGKFDQALQSLEVILRLRRTLAQGLAEAVVALAISVTTSS